MSNSSEQFNIRRRCHGGVAIAIAAATAFAVPVSGFFGTLAYAQTRSIQEHKADVSFLEIDKDITLRRMVIHTANPKGTVLFLHGFPETLYAWKDIALSLAGDYEVHAFDWPGFGLSSRPTLDRFSYAPRDFARVLYDYIRRSSRSRRTSRTCDGP